MEEGIDSVGNPMNLSCPSKLYMRVSRRLLTDLQLTKCLLSSRTSVLSRVTWLVPADGLGAEVICVTSRWENLRVTGQPFLSLSPCQRLEVMGSEFMAEHPPAWVSKQCCGVLFTNFCWTWLVNDKCIFDVSELKVNLLPQHNLCSPY